MSKQYQLGGERKPYSTLRESLIETTQKPLRMLSRGKPQNTNSFWALRNTNFEVIPGEVVGIIGRNGADTSTIISQLDRTQLPLIVELN